MLTESSKYTLVDEVALKLDGFGVAMGKTTILSSVDLSVEARGIHCLLGPSASGKTTLLRTLCGLNNTNPNLRTWGRAIYNGMQIVKGNQPTMSMQSTQLLMATVMQNLLFSVRDKNSLTIEQQRQLAEEVLHSAGLSHWCDKLFTPVRELSIYENRILSFLRLTISRPELICLDEPTADLEEGEAEDYIAFVMSQADKRAILVTTHNQKHAMAFGASVSLLAGGTIQESSTTDCFFKEPKSDYGKIYIRSGSCPSPPAESKEIETQSELCTDLNSSEYRAPRGFFWLLNGRLAGTPRPGVCGDEKFDLECLARVGIDCLISLTERPPVEPAYNQSAMEAVGIKHFHYPFADMSAPSCILAKTICINIDLLLAKSYKLAVNCRAGLGRTGTVLASYLIWRGLNAIEAFEAVRCINPKWIQSQEQIDFLSEFEGFVTAEKPVKPVSLR